MKINDKVYDVLKYVAQVGLPALAVFILAIGPVWDLPKYQEIGTTVVAFNTFLGALLLLNQVRYNASDAKYDGVLGVEITPPGVDNEIQNINIDPTVNEITRKGEVFLKVTPEAAL